MLSFWFWPHAGLSGSCPPPPTTTSPRSSHKRKQQSKEIQKLRARWGDCSAICLHSLVVILRVKMVRWEKVREKHVKHTAVGTDAPRVLSHYSPEPTNGDLCCFPLSLLFICGSAQVLPAPGNDQAFSGPWHP